MYASTLMYRDKKHIGLYLFNDSYYHVFTPEGGILKAAIERAFCWLTNAIQHYSKLTLVFMQLHTATYDLNNHTLSVFIKKLKRALANKYSGKVGTFWVRERYKSEQQHYHLAITVNGHTCRSSFYIVQIAKRIWCSLALGNSMWRIRNPTYRIIRSANNFIYRAAYMRLSYLCKAKSKESAVRCHNFGSSFS
jgi:hypothetical protein